MTQTQKDRSKALREQWKVAKEQLSENKISEIEAIMRVHGLNFSPVGYQIELWKWLNKVLMGYRMSMQRLIQAGGIMVFRFARVKIDACQYHMG